jgi:hypothetical protein
LGDIDIWYNPSVENVNKIIDVIDKFGFGSLGITHGDLTKISNVIQFGLPAFRID